MQLITGAEWRPMGWAKNRTIEIAGDLKKDTSGPLSSVVPFCGYKPSIKGFEKPINVFKIPQQ